MRMKYTKRFSDVDKLMDAICGNSNLLNDSSAFLDALKNAVNDPEIVAFSNVTACYICDLVWRKNKSKTYRKVEMSSNMINVSFTDTFEWKRTRLDQALCLPDQSQVFTIAQKESSCRCLVDQYIFHAIVYSQYLVDAHAQLRDAPWKRYNLKDPHLAVFSNLSIPPARIICESTEATYVFHGSLDYGIGFIRSRDQEMLADGILGINPSNVLSVILEIKAASEMNSGDPQIIGQILVLLEQTKRVAFTGVVTNGVYWRIFVVRIVEELHIYSTATSKAKNNTGLVVELLKDMMLFKL